MYGSRSHSSSDVLIHPSLLREICKEYAPRRRRVSDGRRRYGSEFKPRTARKSIKNRSRSFSGGRLSFSRNSITSTLSNFTTFSPSRRSSTSSDRRASITCPICLPSDEWHQCHHGTDDVASDDDDDEDDPNVKYIKCVIVGESYVGKTSLAYRFARQEFPGKYAPTVCDNFEVKLHKGGERAIMDVWDTAGQEEYDRLRALSYRNTDVFLVCFSVDNPDSFLRVEERWIPEILHFTRGLPSLILVGTKSDLRYSKLEEDWLSGNSSGNFKHFISPSDALDLKNKIGAVHYAECSALKGENVDELFQTAVVSVVHKKQHPRRKECIIL